jgi:hypothetical protein
MIPFLTRLVILLVAGYALYRLWRDYRSTDRWINIGIAAGFLARAVIGQLMFWISYARLPVARQLQMGDGLWFFARDALEYFPVATKLARSGVVAIINYPTSGASVAFVKVLAAAVLLLGSVTSVALLLNLFCYLGTMAVIVRWSERETRARTAAALAICAIVLSPAFFLWSLQPLKDTFFQFIVIAFIGACAAWQRTWTSSPVRMPMAVFAAAAMTVTLMAISGVRWYFAFALFLAAIVFLLLIASLSSGRKAVAFSATALLLILLSRAMLVGGGPYVPAVIVNALTPSTALAEVRELPSQMIAHLNRARDGFERSGGATSIHQGGNMSKLDAALQTRQASTDASTAKPSSADRRPVLKTAADAPKVSKTHPAAVTDSDKSLTTESNVPTGKQAASTPRDTPVPTASLVETVPAAVKVAKAPAQPTPAAPSAPPVTTSAAQLKPASVAAAPPSPSPAAGRETSANAAATTSAAPKESAQQPARKRLKSLGAGAKPALPAPPPPITTTIAAVKTPVSTPAPRPQAVLKQQEAPERTVSTRLLTGAASIVVPRTIGERLGLFHIGGGQGMFWFTEIDTVIFDIALLVAIIAVARRGLLSWRNPLVWLLALPTLLAGVPLGYVITNYGTLFRLREMVYIGLALIPLALATSVHRTVAPEAETPPAP